MGKFTRLGIAGIVLATGLCGIDAITGRNQNPPIALEQAVQATETQASPLEGQVQSQLEQAIEPAQYNRTGGSGPETPFAQVFWKPGRLASHRLSSSARTDLARHTRKTIRFTGGKGEREVPYRSTDCREGFPIVQRNRNVLVRPGFYSLERPSEFPGEHNAGVKGKPCQRAARSSQRGTSLQ